MAWKLPTRKLGFEPSNDVLNKRTIIETETAINALIGQVGLENYFVALHNAFFGGEVMQQNGYDFSDKQLEDLFYEFEALIMIARKIQADSSDE